MSFRCLIHLVARLGSILVVAKLVGFAGASAQVTDRVVDSDKSINKSVPTQRLSVSGVLVPSAPELSKTTYSATVNLPPLAVNSKYRITVAISSPNEEEIVFVKAVPNCACSSVTFDRNGFSPAQPTNVTVKLKTPESDYSGKVDIQISMYRDLECQDEIAQIRLKAKLIGNLSFSDKQFAFQISSANNRFRIPFGFSAPVSVDRLEVVKSKSFGKAVKVSLLSVESEKGVLELVVDPNAADSEDLAGSIVIKDVRLDIQDKCSLLLFKTQPVVFSPMELRFRESGKKSDDGIDRLVAKFLLRIDEPVNQTNSRLIVAKPIRCVLDGQNVVPDYKKLGSSSVYRGQIELPKEMLKQSSGNLNWEIVCESGKRYSLSTSFILED